MTSPLDNAHNNPLLAPYTLPHGALPFDKVRTEHFLPAFEAAIAEARADIEHIKNNRAAPTFANTIEALEFSGETLGRVSRFFNVIAATCRTDEVSAIEETSSRLLTQFDSDFH